MDKKQFIFSKKNVAKLTIILLLGTVLFGVVGLITMLLFQWFTLSSFASDEIAKHGISQSEASRLGGLAIFISTILILISSYFGGLNSKINGPFEAGNIYFWFGVIGCAVIGLVEDFKNNSLSPMKRLLLQICIFVIVIGFWRELIPTNFGIGILSMLMQIPVIGFCLTVIFCVGFVNSVNMADGANGLVPCTMTIVFAIFYLETSNVGYAALMAACGLFTIFNIISGRLFLGDAGAYGLGAASSIGGLQFFSLDVFSSTFLACLFSYPCIDFLVTILRRRLSGKPVGFPDNDHLHNRVHHLYKKIFASKTMANSLTGLSIVSLSSGVTLIGYVNGISMQSELWIFLFAAQCITYLLFFYLSGRYKFLKQSINEV